MNEDPLVPEGVTMGEHLNEGTILRDLVPYLTAAVCQFENCLGIFDSQTKKWLRHVRNGYIKNYLKPDFVVSHEAFSILVEGCSVVPIKLVHELSRSIRSFVEGKKSKAMTFESLGQVVSYTEKLLSLHVDAKGYMCRPVSNVRTTFSRLR
eukprot:m.107860 g.107860  ORF g.107860 m.107860 type:complete len:151 (-) comp12778_c0_seq1:181-633(-)